MLVGWKRISTALGLLTILALGPQGAEAEGPAAGNPNQAIADAVAGVLRADQTLRGRRIEILSQNGQVTLSGSVVTAAEKAQALGLARRVRGVSLVLDGIRVDQAVRPAQYQIARHGFGHHRGATVMDGGMTMGAPVGGGTVVSGPSVVNGGPLPEGAGGMTEPAQSASPNLPNYAWPSTAPYPNFSAVGYPTAYPWQAWPNIGPPYPYPEVPLDWRAVTLRWDDGIWWLDFRKHYTRPFFTPYPFGIFGY